MIEENYEPDIPFAQTGTLEKLVEEYGTPLLVYDRATLETQTESLFRAFSWCPEYRQYFPVKELENPALLRILVQKGCGLLCSNAWHISLAKLAGADDILFSACFPTEEDWKAAEAVGATVILDDPQQLSRISPQVYGDRVLGLRVQPDERLMIPVAGRGHSVNKFGMPRKALLETAKRAACVGFTRLGLHMQAASNVSITGYFEAETQFLLELAQEIQQQTGLDIQWCNLGGGIFWDKKNPEMICLPKEAELVRQKAETMGFAHMPFHTEAGRYVASPAGILLSKVIGVKRQEDVIVGTDASIAHLPRTILPGMRYHISVLGSYGISGRQTCYVAGPIMERIDLYSGRYVLPDVEPGDILIFHGVGAFTRAMASSYGGSLGCPEVLIDQGNCVCIRQRDPMAAWPFAVPEL